MDLITPYQNGITLTQIAHDNNITIDRVRSALKKAGVYQQTKTYKCDLPEQTICDLYKQDLSVEEIAQHFNVSTQPIVRVLKKYNIRKPNWLKGLPWHLSQQVIDREWFVNIVNNHISKQNVAKFLNLQYDMVASLYKYHKIPQISSGDVRSLLNQQQATHPFTKQEFEYLYFDLRTPLGEVAKMMGVSTGYLRHTMIHEWKVEALVQGETRLSPEFRSLRQNQSLLEEEIVRYSVKQLCIKYKVSYSVLRETIDSFGITLPFRARSNAEELIFEYVTNLVGQASVESNSRKIIHPYELDIYLPKHKLAIEYCGLYWHSELQGKDKHYHIKKQEMCEALGIRLLTIFEDEFNKSPNLVFHRIAHEIGTFNKIKIDARKCQVREITPQEKASFLNAFHIQGNDVSKVLLGLIHDESIVAVMTFSTPSRVRNSKTAITTPLLWELNRFATNYDYNVRGAAGKLLKYFQRNYEWNEIFSYADRRWSAGRLYYTLGFSLVSISKPNYWYLDKTLKTREYRYTYAKYKLVQQGFNPNKTEFEIMEERGYTKIWDCGMLKFSISKTPS